MSDGVDLGKKLGDALADYAAVPTVLQEIAEAHPEEAFQSSGTTWTEPLIYETRPRHWQKKIKKTLYTMNIGDFEPAIRDLTYPWMQFYAEKIGADFYEITERKFPEWPITYEKLQIHELGKEHANDWNIFFDADALINPEHFDVTDLITKDTVIHNAKDHAGVRWEMDQYFRRDGRQIGSCNWHTIASDWCLDLWRPLDDLTPQEAISRIHVTTSEKHGYVQPEHLIDDYTLSRNLARFGMRWKSVTEICGERGWRLPNGNGISWALFHLYNLSTPTKIQRMLEIMNTATDKGGWALLGDSQVSAYCEKWNFYFMPVPEIMGWITAEELQWLYRQARVHSAVCEIGSWMGRSTHALLSGCKGKVIAVDHFQGTPSELGGAHAFARTGDVFAEFRKNCCHFRNLEVVRGDSIEASKTVPDDSLDMVFIDGDHTYEAFRADLNAWYPKLKTGGLFCGHDRPMPEIQRALEEFFGAVPKQAVGSIWEAVKT